MHVCLESVEYVRLGTYLVVRLGMLCREGVEIQA